MIFLYKDPEGETVLEPTHVSVNRNLNTTVTIDSVGDSNAENRIAELKRVVAELERKLAEVPLV